MAKIRSTQKISWGGWNPFIKNFIEIEADEISKTDTEVVYFIKDSVIGEKSYLGVNDEPLVSEYVLQVIRERRFAVPMELYNQLYMAAELAIGNELSPFEKEKLMPNIALLIYFQNDKILDNNGNQFCLYGTQPNEWVSI